VVSWNHICFNRLARLPAHASVSPAAALKQHPHAHGGERAARLRRVVQLPQQRAVRRGTMLLAGNAEHRLEGPQLARVGGGCSAGGVGAAGVGGAGRAA
jgi:hypothetical protein